MSNRSLRAMGYLPRVAQGHARMAPGGRRDSESPITGARAAAAGGDGGDLVRPITDHGELDGLADDDHPQYLKPVDVIAGENVTVTDNEDGTITIDAACCCEEFTFWAYADPEDTEMTEFTACGPAAPPVVVPDARVIYTAASVSTLTVGSTVSDLSGNGHHATIATGSLALATSDTPNGSDTIYRTVAGPHAALPSSMWTGLTAVHAFAYVRSVSTSGQRTRGPWHLNGTTNPDYYPYSDELIYAGGFTTTRPSFSSLSVRNAWRVLEVIGDGTTNIVKLDGTTANSWSGSLSLPTTGGRLFDGYPSGTGIAGAVRFAEFRLYGEVLSDAAAAAVRAELVATHGATG